MEPKPLTDAEMDALSAQPQQAQPVQKTQPVKMSVPNRPLTDAEMDAMIAQPAQAPAPQKQGILSAIAQPFKTFYKGTQGAGEVQNQVTGLAEKKQVKSIDEQNRLYAQSKTLPVGSPERRALIQQAGGLAQQEGMVADKSMKTLAEAPQAHQMIGATAEIASYGIGGGAAAKTAGTGIRAGIAQGAKAGLREGAFGGAVQGVGQAMQEDKPTFGSMVKGGLVGGALGGVLGTGLGAGVGALRAAPRMAESGAGRIMNSLIKPLSKDFAYGKNPGAGVANEGIIANSAEELGEKVFQKRQELGSNIGRLLDETPIPPQSIDDTVAIIDGELDSLRRNPQTNSAIINRLEGFKSDFLKLHTGQAPRTQGLSGQDIFNLKSELGDLTKWTGNASDDKIYNKTLKRMYGSLREKLENNIPGLSDLNERFANLTSAKNAIEHRSIIEARQNLVNLPGKIGLGVSGVLGATLNPVAIPAAILSIGIDNALSSTAFKTRFAQALMKMAPDKVAELIESSPLIKRFIGALEKQGDLPPEVSQKIQVYGRNIEQSVPVKNIRQMDVNRPGVLPQQVKLGEPKTPAPVSRKIPVVDESEVVQTMDINRPGVSSQQVKLGEMRKSAPVSKKIPVTEDKGFKMAKPKNYAGGVAGFEEDEDGKMKFNPAKALGGIALGAGAMRANEKGLFRGLDNLSTKLLEKFRGLPEEITPQKFNEVINRAQKEGIKKVDLDMVREAAERMGEKINLPKLAKDVEQQLVPLTPTPVKSPRWSNIGADFIGDGRYGEIVYESPIKTSAGDIHFQKKGTFGPVDKDGFAGPAESFPNYFSHVRYEDKGTTRKLMEVQSDLMQKENFANMTKQDYSSINALSKLEHDEYISLAGKMSNYKIGSPEYIPLKKRFEELKAKSVSEMSERIKPLKNYESNDPLAHLRTFREEVKRAAKDGKDTLLVPTGETAMKIEGLGASTRWVIPDKLNLGMQESRLTPEKLDVGLTVQGFGQDGTWVITDVLGDGRFKAIERSNVPIGGIERIHESKLESLKETFDISGKVDSKHFVYKLNEEAIPKEARKQGLIVEGKIKQDNGEWWKIQIPKEKARMPVEAFAAVPGLIASKESEAKRNAPNPKSPQSNYVQAPTRPVDSIKRIPIKGTNYDPLDPNQTRKNTDGKGAAGVKMTDRMVAVMRKSASDGTPSLPYGTIIYVPELDKEFMVADIFNYRYNSKDSKATKVDFAVPGSGGKILPEYNRDLTIQVIEMGKGAKDAREKASRFQGVVDE